MQTDTLSVCRTSIQKSLGLSHHGVSFSGTSLNSGIAQGPDLTYRRTCQIPPGANWNDGGNSSNVSPNEGFQTEC